MKKLIYFFLFVLTFSSCTVSQRTFQSKQEKRYVVVLSLDAFRADYPEMYSTPTLDSLAKVGVKSTFRPCFPSLTFPNHYSMATGLHPESHGLVHNTFRTVDGDIYRIADRRKVEDPTFYGGEPIWVTAHRQGLKTASFYWVGSETAIQGVQPDFWKKFDSKVSYSARADSVISWLALPESERPQLVMWYIEEPDHTSHTFAPQSKETRQVVEHLDSVVGQFCKKLNALPIANQIDFIVVADHGMAAYEYQKDINLANYLPRDSFEYIVEGSPTLLYPKKSYREEAYKILKDIPHLQVWYREDVPSKYRYSNNDRIGDLVVLPDVGIKLEFRNSATSQLKAAHGFDNFAPKMQAIFYASGSSFAKGKETPAMENVNLYLIISKLLGLKPAKNDGKEEDIKPIFR